MQLMVNSNVCISIYMHIFIFGAFMVANMFILFVCHNPNLRLVIKARTCKGAGQEWSPRVAFHALGSVGEFEGMNLHTPKWTLTLGVGVPMDSQNFREQF